MFLSDEVYKDYRHLFPHECDGAYELDKTILTDVPNNGNQT